MRDHSLDFVEGNNINGLNIIFKFTDFFFEKISSNLKERFQEKLAKIRNDLLFHLQQHNQFVIF